MLVFKILILELIIDSLVSRHDTWYTWVYQLYLSFTIATSVMIKAQIIFIMADEM